ncbi:MAG: hypothetical protein U0R68_11775 [Candidatus Nanopelagicales bacterium]
MPAPTRCPSCSAALAPGASWCSLCHADLRPKLEPVRRNLDVVPGTVPTATPVAAVGSATPSAAAPAGAVGTAVDDAPAPRPRGRHARIDDDDEPDLELDLEPAPAPAPPPVRATSGGRHARGRASARRSRPTVTAASLAPIEPLDLEGRELAPEEVDEIADQMLTQLAVSEPQQRFFDPDELPGGKFVFMAGLGLAIIVVLVVLYTVLGMIFG